MIELISKVENQKIDEMIKLQCYEVRNYKRTITNFVQAIRINVSFMALKKCSTFFV